MEFHDKLKGERTVWLRFHIMPLNVIKQVRVMAMKNVRLATVLERAA
jgi:hypothetical protein